MAFFDVPSGCFSPSSGGTDSQYELKFNNDKIVSYFKSDISKSKNTEWQTFYNVVVTFENYTQIFKFLVSSDRDAFYTSLP